jgi:hypothetical protein
VPLKFGENSAALMVADILTILMLKAVDSAIATRFNF